MTDEQIIKLLKNIKEHCNHNTDCCNCEFLGKRGECQIFELSKELNFMPCNWDIGKLERIIKQ